MIKKKVHCIIKQLGLILSRHCCCCFSHWSKTFIPVKLPLVLVPLSASLKNLLKIFEPWSYLNYHWYIVFIWLSDTTIYFYLLLQNVFHISYSSPGSSSSTQFLNLKFPRDYLWCHSLSILTASWPSHQWHGSSQDPSPRLRYGTAYSKLAHGCLDISNSTVVFLTPHVLTL